MNPFELHPERLATTDEVGRRVYLYPADVRGFFRKYRTIVQFVLMAVFLALPWLHVGGKQFLLLNITEREFNIFGLALRAHNAPLLFFVFATGAFGLFFVTSIWGRVWCGWACPQTVFIDGVFRRIERWIEGSALDRRRLDASPWSTNKLARKTLKWVLFTLASLVITHSFLGYFVGTDRLAKMVTSSPLENWSSFLFMFVATAIVLFDFAWFREQFCIIACPYGRFQSVLMDSHSTVVAYDEKRGEPRATTEAKTLAKLHGQTLGDCVNCYRCVQVCPVGIDIRRGVQMECIACTGCIDACDEVMTKQGKPTGLIRYDSLRGLRGGRRKIVRWRSGLYFLVAAISAISLIVLLNRSQKLDVVVLRAKDTPYTVAGIQGQESQIHNHLKLELSNQTGADRELRFAVLPDVAGVQLIAANPSLRIAEGELKRVDIFLRFPATVLVNGAKKIRIAVQSMASNGSIESIEKEVTLVGPIQ
ncbi:MAG TPA: cytochrome c oxidase accessory protein CcoG [Bdellovibrionales bacterium]|jgi:cytochrome c oxidase accessory protein FixG|nr:cytochrome c oxidase accessory protein CcoG [Bdellovibrionales bacterium]